MIGCFYSTAMMAITHGSVLSEARDSNSRVNRQGAWEERSGQGHRSYVSPHPLTNVSNQATKTPWIWTSCGRDDRVRWCAGESHVIGDAGGNDPPVRAIDQACGGEFTCAMSPSKKKGVRLDCKSH